MDRRPPWFQREGIRTFAGQPLVFRGEALGVLAIFDRAALKDTDFAWLRIFADHAAVNIGNVNAFEEIAFLKERLEEENIYLREGASVARGLDDLVGESAGLRKVLKQIDLVATTDSTVLITGESGTGKELVARAIHSRSERKDRALIKVNCGAVPEPLFESEFLVMPEGLLRELCATSRGGLSLPTAAPSSSMKSAKFRLPCKPSFCESSRNRKSSAWVRHGRAS